MKFSEVAPLVREASRIAVTGHKRGDIDCYGSAFGLVAGLSAIGKEASVVTGEEIPGDLEYLYFYFDGKIEESIDDRVDLLIIVDTSDLARLSASDEVGKYLARGGKTILLDHHTLGDLTATVTSSIVDTTACSSSEITYGLLSELEVPFDKNISTCLLAGIIGDTSSFQNQSTTEACLDTASALMRTGGRLQTIINHTFGNKEVNALKLWGLAMERLSVNEKYGVVTTYLTYEDILSFGLSAEAITGIVNYLNSVKGARVVSLLTEEEPGRIKVSFRTRDESVDVARLARQLGGGGHVKASGLTFSGSLRATDSGVQLV